MTTTSTPIGLAPGAPEEAAGQDAAKYGTTNPVVQRLLGRWMDEIHDILGDVAGVVVDVGVGEALALERMIPNGHPAVGLEYRIDKARAAKDRLGWLAPVSGDAGMLPFPDACADLVTCIELLEHLPTYRPAVAELARITRGRCVVSVPWEPWFRSASSTGPPPAGSWRTRTSAAIQRMASRCCRRRSRVARG